MEINKWIKEVFYLLKINFKIVLLNTKTVTAQLQTLINKLVNRCKTNQQISKLEKLYGKTFN